MKIYTSYYKNINFLKAHDVVPVGISRFEPSYIGINIFELSPSADLLMKYKNDKDKSYYIKEFGRQLSLVNIQEITDALEKISSDNDNKDIALCCYEMPDEFCHRHLVAKFLMENTEYDDVHEYTARDAVNINKTIELF